MKTTDNGFHATAGIAIAALLLISAAVRAQTANCIELTTVAETAQEYVDAQGRKATRLAPVGKALPGDEVVWTITAKNVCDEPVDDVVIANPVPEHMTYIATSAMGVGTAITYSIDGKEFKAVDTLTVSDAGVKRAAKPEEYRAIRWTYQASFAPGATGFVRYRARVQ